MMNQILIILGSAAFYQSMLRISAPILIAAMGDVVSERCGTLNMGLEGMMLCGAFFGFIGSYFSGSPWIGLACAVASAMVIGVVEAFCCISLALNQAVVAVAVNILCSGLCGTLLRTIFGATTSTLKCATFPRIEMLPTDTFFGAVLSQTWLPYLGLLLIPITWWVFYKTTVGLKIRSCGENPKAANSMGIRVIGWRYACMLYSAAMAGVAGSVLTLDSLGMYVDDLVAGRGYIAFAAIIFGKYHPVGTAVGALLFGFANTFQTYMQSAGVDLPYQIMLMFPYAITLVALLVMGAGISPKGWAAPYIPDSDS